MDWLTILILTVCVILVILPPKYDPAIRLKEWAEEKRYSRQRKKTSE